MNGLEGKSQWLSEIYLHSGNHRLTELIAWETRLQADLMGSISGWSANLP